ncbi:penicillin-binding protein [Pseudomonas sp. 21]|uniref:penicillin-binding protein 1C n=1 Tax=unclassified Pseudomonas TaxID=196821 RepID=UPI0005EAD4D3|nr:MULTISPECIES: penicillin-binding protein 1C [unclassified Pseudomonas]KJK01617.1 penicillin-binding protein [Pseudomonas sp. 21]MBV7582264.1 penicillin-binding protein 1C [Pseudomonas sp. PDM33]
MRGRPLVLGAVLACALLASLRLWPHAPLQSVAPSSRVVLAEHGELLRLTLANDGQYRLWIPLERMAPALVQAIQLKEDRRFHWHPGINPLALLRAMQSTYSGGMRQGGSTLTMQLARRIYELNTRQVPGKVQQLALALWLEARYSKHEILEAYLNLAPMGGNIEGAEAASRIYFGKPAEQLSLAEALALAVIPQQPGRRARFGDALEAARLRLLANWRENYPDDPRNDGPLELPLQARTRAQLPFLAPHLSEQLLQRYPQRELRTTLNLPLQQLLERLIEQYISEQRPQGVENAVALLIDRRDQSVKALVGSADYASKSIHGQVNGITSRRSPGSTLKPFLYGLAIDQGLIHPMSVLKDAPSAYGYFQPENYDGRFVGPISAQDALVRSRNIPAVTLAGQLHAPTLYGLLKRSGVQGLRAESHYGLALTLGAGEVTPEDLGRLYLALGGDGRLRQLRYLLETPQGSGEALLSPQAAFLVRDMLRHNPRPDGLPQEGRGRQWRSAWKTGTSWGFRDAWSSGLVGPYVLVVWVGNFDGRGNPAFVGVKTAAPLFFRIADALPLALPNERDPMDKPPAGVARIQVCQASGDLPNRWCPQTRKTWYIPGVSPIKVSDLHRPVQIDSRTGRAVCGELDPKYRHEEVYEFWPSDLQRLFRAAGLPRRPLPKGARDCLASSVQVEEGPRIRSPLQQVAYSLRLSHPEDSIPLAATAAGDARRLYWFAEQSLVAQNAPQDGSNWRPPRSGDYHLRVTDDRGRSSERLVKVEFLP